MTELSALGAVIKDAYEGQPDTNAFTDADKAKLDELENYEPQALDGEAVQAALDTLANNNVFTDLDKQRIAELFARSYFSGSFTDLTDVPEIVLESRRAAANGVASLDASGKVPLNQLNVSGLQFKGVWNPNTNTPALVDGTGTVGDFYKASHAGTYNTGNSTYTYAVGDWVIYAGGTWSRLGSADTVATVNGKLGDVVLTASDVRALPDTYTPPTPPVLSVNGKADGAVVLTAADVKALPETYTPPNQVKKWDDIQEKPNFPLLYQAKQRGTIGPAISAVLARLDAEQSLTHNAWTRVRNSVILRDPFNLHNASLPGQFIAPSWAKWVRVTSSAQFSGNNNGERQLVHRIGTGSIMGSGVTRQVVNTTGSFSLNCAGAIVACAPGTVVEAAVLQSSGSSMTLQQTNATWIHIEFFE